MENDLGISTKSSWEDDAKKEIVTQLCGFISELKPEDASSLIEPCKNQALADLSVPVPKIAKYVKLSQKPDFLAKDLASKFQKLQLLEEISAAGVYLNFKINKSSLVKQTLQTIFDQKEAYGCSSEGQGKKVLVEFSSPNIAKPFHAGHLRSTIIGSFIRNLKKSLGYDVTAINYLGDWGKQYGLLAVGFAKYGSKEALQADPIKHLLEVYVKINADGEKDDTVHEEARLYFKKMEDGDKEALDLWKLFRDLSWKEFEKIYDRLGVSFDLISGESKFSERMQQEIAKIKDKGLLTESKGAMVVDLKEHDLGVAIITKKDGATVYITRDIASASWRYETYKFDEMYYVVAAQQDHHFKQLFKLLELMGYDWSKTCNHINFGMVMGMSTRKGNVVFLEDMVDEAKATMLEVMKKNEKKFANVSDPEAIADKVGMAAVIIQDFTSRRVKDYKFDWKRMTSFEGNTGPFLQYSHARLCSIEAKAAERGIVLNTSVAAETLLKEKEATDLITQLAQYPSVLQQADKVLEPCVVVGYLMTLAHAISIAHEKLHVLNLPPEERSLAEARLWMFWAARITLRSGMKMLGLSPVEKM